MTPIRTTLLIEVIHNRHIPNLARYVEQRLWTIPHVAIDRPEQAARVLWQGETTEGLE